MQADTLRRFLFDDLGIRGEWVQLTASWQASKQYQLLSGQVESILGQALAAVVLLSATIKFQGSMILQIQSEGAIKAIVAQASDQRHIRALARCDDFTTEGALHELCHNGRLVLTVSPDQGEPYQGVIALHEPTLARALEHYFQQSEQLPTRLWLFANSEQAGGLLLQQLPNKTDSALDWERIEHLANTLTEHEMLTLDCETVLYRLFHQEHLRLFADEPVQFRCTCSHERIIRTLRAMGAEELHAVLQQRGEIEIICEFCLARYVFTPADIDALLTEQPRSVSPRLH